MIANGKQNCVQVKLKIMTVQSTVILVIIIIINTYVWYFLYDKMASLPVPINSENVFVLPVAVSDEIVSRIGALLLSVSPIHYTIIPWLIFDCYLLGLRRVREREREINTSFSKTINDNCSYTTNSCSLFIFHHIIMLLSEGGKYYKPQQHTGHIYASCVDKHIDM